MESLATTIRVYLDAYLSGRISLDEFTGWLVSATWNITYTGDAEATELTFAIELGLAEHSSGLLTLAELRTELACIRSGECLQPQNL